MHSIKIFIDDAPRLTLVSASMSNNFERFVQEVERYCERTGWKESTFGQYACNNARFMQKLRDGRGVSTLTIERARQYMVDNPPPRKRKSA